jgi:hypothetical protein
MNANDHTIIGTFGARYRGIVQYYLLAGDVWRLNRLHWGHADLVAEDLGGEASLVGIEDGPPIPGRHRDTTRAS